MPNLRLYLIPVSSVGSDHAAGVFAYKSTQRLMVVSKIDNIVGSGS